MSGAKRKRSAASNVHSEGEGKREIRVTSSWGSLLEHRLSAPSSARRIGAHDVWLVDGLFSPEECTVLLAHAEAHGFGTTHYEPTYRGNLRLTTIDKTLADAVWERLRESVPSSLTLSKPESEAERGDLWWEQYPDADGVWEACGLNECWRLAKYRAGDRFLCHCDEAFVRTTDNGRTSDGRADGGATREMSMLTVNIYMNGDFEGGRTRFFLRQDWWEQFGANYRLKEGAEADAAVVPAPGRCLLFQQPPGRGYYHDGEAVFSGCKYLFRSDVMYRKVASLPCSGERWD